MWVEYLFLFGYGTLKASGEIKTFFFFFVAAECAIKTEKGKRQWQENRWDTSATWWRVRFPVSESTEASSRSMYISRSPQSWSLPDSLSRLRIILIKITVRSLCNKPSSSITCAAETEAGNALPTQTSSGFSYPFRNHKRRKVNSIWWRDERNKINISGITVLHL